MMSHSALKYTKKILETIVMEALTCYIETLLNQESTN